jgi:hypothetical protein
VAGDGEKPGRPADRVDLGAKGPLLAGRPSFKTSQIEDGKMRVAGHAESLSPRRRPGNEGAVSSWHGPYRARPLRAALAKRGWSRLKLAKQRGMSENSVRRLLDLRHSSVIGAIPEPFAALHDAQAAARTAFLTADGNAIARKNALG